MPATLPVPAAGQSRHGPRGEREPRGKESKRTESHARCLRGAEHFMAGYSMICRAAFQRTWWYGWRTASGNPPSPQKVCRQGGRSIQRNAAVRNMWRWLTASPPETRNISYGIVWSSGGDHVPMELNRVQWRQDQSWECCQRNRSDSRLQRVSRMHAMLVAATAQAQWEMKMLIKQYVCMYVCMWAVLIWNQVMCIN